MLLFMYVCPVAKCCEKKWWHILARAIVAMKIKMKMKIEDSTSILNAKLQTFGAV